MKKRFVAIVVVCIGVVSLTAMICETGFSHTAGRQRRSSDILTRHLKLPLRNFTLSVDQLMEKPWYAAIQAFLAELTTETKDIVLLSCSETFLPVLLNWLAAYSTNIARQTDLSEILVLAMDHETHQFLSSRGFNSVHISNEDIFLPYIRLKSPYSHIWIKRCTVARVLNHLGYNIMMFDLDAVLLKDIFGMLLTSTHNDDSVPVDIVGSMGKYPYTLGREWGFTLCMGVVMFRSSPGTETFWKAVSGLKIKNQDDQVRTNLALKNLQIEWSKDTNCPKRESKDECSKYGKAVGGLHVTLLSSDIVCRSCSRRNIHKYYVWHNHSSRNATKKEVVARKGHVWFLRDDWKNVMVNNPRIKGKELMELITLVPRLLRKHIK